MQMAVIVVLAYLVGVFSTGVATLCRARHRERDHALLVAALQQQLRPRQPVHFVAPREWPPRIPPPAGPVAPPPYW
jgi:hypothetical protein